MKESNARVAAVLMPLAVMGAALAWSCGSSDEEAGGGGGGDAKQAFTTTVYPSLAKECGECHQKGQRGAPVFLGAGADPSYTAIEGFPGLVSAPSISPLVQKGVHSGPALTATQADNITKWLKLEVSARKLQSDPGTPKNLRAAFKAFGECMDYVRWRELKLDTIALTDTEGNQGKCVSCHNYGDGSMWLSGSPNKEEHEVLAAETFLKLREFPYVQRLAIGRVNAEGTFDGIEGARRILDKGNEAQQPQANNHPRFALTSELAGNLTTFVTETISNMNANRCQNVTVPEAGTD